MMNRMFGRRCRELVQKFNPKAAAEPLITARRVTALLMALIVSRTGEAQANQRRGNHHSTGQRIGEYGVARYREIWITLEICPLRSIDSLRTRIHSLSAENALHAFSRAASVSKGVR